ncbi:succinate--CoA ligase subunit beta, partial [Acinetobacter baumannii]
LTKEQSEQFTKTLMGIYKIIIDCDASMVEINPMIVTKEGNIFTLDAKLNFDENALYRQKPIAEQRDLSQEDERERIAQQFDL